MPKISRGGQRGRQGRRGFRRVADNLEQASRQSDRSISFTQQYRRWQRRRFLACALVTIGLGRRRQPRGRTPGQRAVDADHGDAGPPHRLSDGRHTDRPRAHGPRSPMKVGPRSRAADSACRSPGRCLRKQQSDTAARPRPAVGRCLRRNPIGERVVGSRRRRRRDAARATVQVGRTGGCCARQPDARRGGRRRGEASGPAPRQAERARGRGGGSSRTERLQQLNTAARVGHTALPDGCPRTCGRGGLSSARSRRCGGTSRW